MDYSPTRRVVLERTSVGPDLRGSCCGISLFIYGRCWIAYKNSFVAGSVFLVREKEKVAKLRLLYVEPATRGLGIGRSLVYECIRFARLCGCQTLKLWRISNLSSSRRIYENAGFKSVEETPQHSFGHDLIRQIGQIEL